MSSDQDHPKLEPSIIVIFGMTGDLSRRKLLPALYHLFKDRLLDEQTSILGVTRREVDLNEILNEVKSSISESDHDFNENAWDRLQNEVQMIRLDITKSSEYKALLKKLNDIEAQHGVCMNRLYYLSVPPETTGSIVTYLGENGLNKSCQHGAATTRLLIEKPFGRNYKSAYQLIQKISKQFKENQIFRIDHYIAKETVQNIVTFRFNNLFEEMWNREYISSILISAVETIGIEGRGIFYEQVGALRDFVENHLMQLLAVTTLDLPSIISSETIHEAKLDLLKKIPPVPLKNVDKLTARGQYEGYRKEANSANSEVETYAALQLQIKSERWRGVPILLRSGKMLDQKKSEIRVVFRPRRLGSPSNILVFRLQPEEGIGLDLLVKKPGFGEEPQPTAMDFSYQNVFDNNGHPDAYERVLVDAVKGDHTLFSTSKEVLRSWEIVNPILDAWAKDSKSLEFYEEGSAGPDSALKLAKRNNINWHGDPIKRPK